MMLSKYVDDINMIIEMLGLGVYWNSKTNSLECSQEKEDQDKLSKESGESRTAKEILKLANYTGKELGLKFTKDTPEDHKNKKVPMLDLQVWVEKHMVETLTGEVKEINILLHEYYEKEVTSKLVMMATSAMPWRQKITTLKK